MQTHTRERNWKKKERKKLSTTFLSLFFSLDNIYQTEIRNVEWKRKIKLLFVICIMKTSRMEIFGESWSELFLYQVSMKIYNNKHNGPRQEATFLRKLCYLNQSPKPRWWWTCPGKGEKEEDDEDKRQGNLLTITLERGLRNQINKSFRISSVYPCDIDNLLHAFSRSSHNFKWYKNCSLAHMT